LHRENFQQIETIQTAWLATMDAGRLAAGVVLTDHLSFWTIREEFSREIPSHTAFFALHGFNPDEIRTVFLSRIEFSVNVDLGWLPMSFLAQVHISCFLLSYLVALGCELLRVFGRPFAMTRLLMVGFTCAGLIAHTAYLISRSQHAGLPPLLTSQQDWLLVMAWRGGGLYLILLMTHREAAQGLFLLPAILLLILVALFVSTESAGNLQEVALRRWGMFHAASLVLGIGAVFGASMTGLMYLLHHQRLRSHSGWLRTLVLPSLENLTAINRWMVVFSVPCLTIGMLTGFLLISWSTPPGSGRSISWTDPTILTTVIVWMAMVVVLIRLLSSAHQTGKAVAQLSLLSGGFLLVTVFGPMLLANSGNLDTFHGRAPTRPAVESDREAADSNLSNSSATSQESSR